MTTTFERIWPDEVTTAAQVSSAEDSRARTVKKRVRRPRGSKRVGKSIGVPSRRPTWPPLAVALTIPVPLLVLPRPFPLRQIHLPTYFQTTLPVLLRVSLRTRAAHWPPQRHKSDSPCSQRSFPLGRVPWRAVLHSCCPDHAQMLIPELTRSSVRMPVHLRPQ